MSTISDMTKRQRTRQRARRHYERHGDRRSTGTSTSTGRTHVRLNADTRELADVLLWQETNQARFSTIAGAVNGMLRLMLHSIREQDPNFEGFPDTDSANEYLQTYVENQLPTRFQISATQRTAAPKSFTQQELTYFARIDAAAARGFVEEDLTLFDRKDTQLTHVAIDDPDVPLSDEELRNLGSDGVLRPYVSRVEPPPADVATSHETYDVGD